MNPLVTICMPAYNSEGYIENSIKTICSQSYKNYELIIIDDGSIDKTKTVADHLIKKYNMNGYALRIKNSGPEAARDFGFSYAKGDLFATLDSDDLWDNGYLDEMVSVFSKHPDVGATFADFNIIYNDRKKNERKSNTVDFFRLEKANYQNGDVYIFTPKEFFQISLQGMLLFPSCTVVRKSIYFKAGRYTKNFDRTISCDWDYALRVSKEAPVAYIHKPLMTKIFYGNNVSIDGIKTALSDIVVLENLLNNGTLAEPEKRIAKKRLASRMYNVGYGYLQNDNITEARKWFKKSIIEKPMKNNIKYLIIASLNKKLFLYLRNIKRSMAL